MVTIVAVHSFRGGTGKSNTTANVAALLASAGHNVAVVDTDIQSPGLHVLFGLDGDALGNSLNDFLWGKCDITQTAYDATPDLGPDATRRLFLIPASLRAGEIARVLREGYDVGLLNDGFHELIRALGLDVLMIDTHPGLNEETLLSIAISHVLAIILRPDQQDYQGTSVAVEVARKLGVPRLLLVVNKVPDVFDPGEVQARVEATYQAEVAAVLPHSDDLMALASAGIFALRCPDHPMTAALGRVAAALIA